MQQKISRIVILSALVGSLLLVVSSVFVGSAHAQSALDEVQDLKDAFSRYTNESEEFKSTYTEAARKRDRALLFANNNRVNYARMAGEIPNDAYQRVQDDFDQLSQQFAKGAADKANAGFTVQKRTSPKFMPGTDSDYITVVESEHQIRQMQEDYNKRVNEFMKESGAPEINDKWHEKLDVDFMADPEKITDPAEFERIAEMNNDAYKNRFAAEYERISRSKDGTKIGPQHVEGYMEEMNAFAQKKRDKIDKLKKNPAAFNSSKARGEYFQAMAQEQKYVSRLESLDDFLRKQEGLPPRNRGVTTAKLGSDRNWDNAKNTRAGSALAEAGRLDAMEDLVETLAEVSNKNTGFNPNAADDIARVIEQLPPERRANALRRIGNNNLGMMGDIVEASQRSGRLPKGTGLAQDVVRARSEDLGKLVNNLDGMSDIGKARRVMRGAMDTLEAIGKVTERAEVLLAISQLHEIFRIREQMLDPNLSDAEAEKLQARAQAIANELALSGALGALMELNPKVAIAYGAWTLACMGGEWRSPTRAGSDETCLDRQLSAFNRAHDTWTGKEAEREAQAISLCNKLKAAVDENRIRLLHGFTKEEACRSIRYGVSIADMYEHTSPGEKSSDENEQQTAQSETGSDAIALVPAVCNAAQNNATIAQLAEAAANGDSAATTHVAKLRSINV